jgi:hypothetical protein
MKTVFLLMKNKETLGLVRSIDEANQVIGGTPHWHKGTAQLDWRTAYHLLPRLEKFAEGEYLVK